jgi:hypothetical protein
LLTLNDTGYVEAARVLAQQVLASESRDSERLAQIFLKILGRRPRPAESQILLEGLRRHRATYAHQPELATQWIRTGEHPTSSSLNPVELAAWTVTASTVLNLDEALTTE